MPKVKIKGKTYRAMTIAKHGNWDTSNTKVSKPKRQQIFYKNAEQMPEYNKTIINVLARIKSGQELDSRLHELKFCSYETAIEVLKEIEKNGTTNYEE